MCHSDAIIGDKWSPFPLQVLLQWECVEIVEPIGSDVREFCVGAPVAIGPAGVNDRRIAGA